MSTDGRPNTGPLDFFYLLKRRGVSFERWCQSVGIKTRKDFVEIQQKIEAQGEYFFPKEMLDLCSNLPQDPNELFLKGEKPQETAETQDSANTPSHSSADILDPVEPQEEIAGTKKAKRAVST